MAAIKVEADGSYSEEVEKVIMVVMVNIRKNMDSKLNLFPQCVLII